jgi:hypothetical protein
MKLLGERNWYLPTWLEWIPNVAIEGTPVESTVDNDKEDHEKEMVSA